MPNNTNIEYYIRRVKDVYFVVNEMLYVHDSTKIIKVELGNRLGFSVTSNHVQLIFRIYYHYDGEEGILADIQVENVFEVINLKQFERADKIVILPPALITTFVSMAISHGRALLLKNTAGTAFQDVVLPVTNSEAVARHFFPYMFGEEATLGLFDPNNNKINEATINEKEKSISK